MFYRTTGQILTCHRLIRTAGKAELNQLVKAWWSQNFRPEKVWQTSSLSSPSLTHSKSHTNTHKHTHSHSLCFFHTHSNTHTLTLSVYFSHTLFNKQTNKKTNAETFFAILTKISIDPLCVIFFISYYYFVSTTFVTHF